MSTVHLFGNESDYDTILSKSVSYLLDKTKPKVHYILFNEALVHMKQTKNDTKLLSIIETELTTFVKKEIKHDSIIYSILKKWEELTTGMLSLKTLVECKKTEINTIQYLGTKLFFEQVIHPNYDTTMDYFENQNDMTLFADFIRLYETCFVIYHSNTTHKTPWQNEHDFSLISRLSQSSIIIEKVVKYIHDRILYITYLEPDNIDKKSEEYRKIRLDIKDTLSQCYTLINMCYYFADKVLVYTYWTKYLELRLLMQKKIMITTERSMLTKLIKQFGLHAILYDAQKMIEDIVQSRVDNEVIHKKVVKVKKKGIVTTYDLSAINPNVIKAYRWSKLQRSTDIKDVKLPEELDTMLRVFLKTYEQKNESKHKLTLAPNYGFAVISFKGKNDFEYSFYVNTLQLVVLWLFNEKKYLTVEQISTVTNINAELTNNIVSGLFDSKLLVKNKDDVYKVNTNYSNKDSNVSLVEYFSTTKIETIVTEFNEEERKIAINANITSILKQETKLQRSVLFTKLKSAVQFEVTNKMFGCGLQYLLKHEYIKLSDNNEIEYLS